MKTKKTPAKKSHRKLSSIEKLDCLNNAFMTAQTEHEALLRAMERNDVTEIANRKKSSDAAYENFSKQRHSLPALKFDSHSGKYFYAHDFYDRSGEVYHILCVAKLEEVVHVIAKDEKNAIEKAAKLVNTGNRFYGASKIDIVNVSQRA